MKPQEINWNEWEEIEVEEYGNLSADEGLEVKIGFATFLFKKREVWPKVFKDGSYTIEVSHSGDIKLYELSEMDYYPFYVGSALSLLIQAVECAKKQMEKKK